MIEEFLVPERYRTTSRCSNYMYEFATVEEVERCGRLLQRIIDRLD